MTSVIKNEGFSLSFSHGMGSHSGVSVRHIAVQCEQKCSLPIVFITGSPFSHATLVPTVQCLPAVQTSLPSSCGVQVPPDPCSPTPRCYPVKCGLSCGWHIHDRICLGQTQDSRIPDLPSAQVVRSEDCVSIALSPPSPWKEKVTAYKKVGA